MSADPKYQSIVIEKRSHPRQRVLRFLPGRICKADSREPIVCRPLDVSPMGMGIFAEEELDEGARLVLDLGDRTIDLVIVWSIESPGDAVGYRYGLKSVEPQIDLQKVFEEKGC